MSTCRFGVDEHEERDDDDVEAGSNENGLLFEWEGGILNNISLVF